MVRANRVDVDRRRQVWAKDNRLRRGRSSANNVRTTYRFAGRTARRHGNSQFRGHFLTKLLSPGGIAAINAHGFEFSNGGNRFELRSGLASRSDHGGSP